MEIYECLRGPRRNMIWNSRVPTIFAITAPFIQIRCKAHLKTAVVNMYGHKHEFFFTAIRVIEVCVNLEYSEVKY